MRRMFEAGPLVILAAAATVAFVLGLATSSARGDSRPLGGALEAAALTFLGGFLARGMISVLLDAGNDSRGAGMALGLGLLPRPGIVDTITAVFTGSHPLTAPGPLLAMGAGVGAFAGMMNGLYRIYSGPLGLFQFLSDVTWGLSGTTTASLIHLWNVPFGTHAPLATESRTGRPPRRAEVPHAWSRHVCLHPGMGHEQPVRRSRHGAPSTRARPRSAEPSVRLLHSHLPGMDGVAGPGWALVGDAGYTRDPITAQGMTDSFRDAELCASAIDESLDGRRPFEVAMAAYQSARNAQVMGIYEFTTQLATLEPPPPEMQQLLGAVHGNPEAMDAFASVAAGTLSPEVFFSPDHIGQVMGAAAARESG